MKEKPLSKATRTVYTILRQIATLIPREFVNAAVRDETVEIVVRHAYQTFH